MTYHTTHDGKFSVSDAAAKVLAQARFPSSHTMGCDCAESKGKIRPENCEHVNIRDADGKVIAQFLTREFGAQRAEDGSIVVFRRPASQTQDSAKLTLRKLNQWHLQFYRRGETQTEPDDEPGNLNRPHEGRL